MLVAAAWAAVLSVPADVDVPVGAVLVAEGPSPGPETYDCTGKDGYFADYYRQCHVFYRCLPDGTKFTYVANVTMATKSMLTLLPFAQPTQVHLHSATAVQRDRQLPDVHGSAFRHLPDADDQIVARLIPLPYRRRRRRRRRRRHCVSVSLCVIDRNKRKGASDATLLFADDDVIVSPSASFFFCFFLRSLDRR